MNAHDVNCFSSRSRRLIVSEGGLELRRQRCRTVVKNPDRLVSSGPGTPPLPIHDGKSGQIRGCADWPLTIASTTVVFAAPADDCISETQP